MSQSVRLSSWCLCLCLTSIAGTRTAADESKPKPQNTISVKLAEPVPAPKFERAPKFSITDVTDRSGNPQPMVVFKDRGGLFLDRQPTAILREAIDDSLKSANLRADDPGSADLTVRLYLFHFGLAEGSGLDFFSKVEFSAVVKNPKTGESQEVKATGTAIARGAVRKKNIQKNVEENLQEALKDATRNFLRGVQLKEAINSLWKAPDASPVASGMVDSKTANTGNHQ